MENEMANSRIPAPGGKVQGIGMPWYTPQDYAAARAIMTDAKILPLTYKEWLEGATKLESNLKAQGHIVIRAEINSRTFADWCKSHGLTVDTKGRSAFGADHAATQMGLR
jgi:hypothetical protein